MNRGCRADAGRAHGGNGECRATSAGGEGGALVEAVAEGAAVDVESAHQLRPLVEELLVALLHLRGESLISDTAVTDHNLWGGDSVANIEDLLEDILRLCVAGSSVEPCRAANAHSVLQRCVKRAHAFTQFSVTACESVAKALSGSRPSG